MLYMHRINMLFCPRCYQNTGWGPSYESTYFLRFHRRRNAW